MVNLSHKKYLVQVQALPSKEQKRSISFCSKRLMSSRVDKPFVPLICAKVELVHGLLILKGAIILPRVLFENEDK